MAIILSKVLAPTDIECNLLIPTADIVNLPFGEGDLLNMTVHDHNSEREWVFCCTVRRNDMTDVDGVLSVGWLEFVRAKNLKPNDEVVFHEGIDHAGNATLRIEVTRKIRLLGKDIWAQVP